MPTPQPVTASLPAEGFVTIKALIGSPEVTPEQAQRNRERGIKSSTKPRQGRQGVLPWSRATFWRRVRDSGFPPPIKIGGTTVWHVGDVRSWIASQNSEVTK